MYSQPHANTPAAVYTVSRLNREIRTVLERGFASIVLNGEISNFVAPASGHWYFSLKDDKSQVRAAMWRGNNRYAQIRPKNGDQVQVHARVSLYEPRGDYQVIVERMEAAGEGLLKQQFEALKMRLASEGLFNSSYKKPLPSSINKVGVVTSSTGAAIKDILTVLKRRAPQLEVVIYPCQVQGDSAHQGIIDKIALANARKEVDVLIVGRGGGSLEDLWCFNHEQLARAIFASELPVISAVGHEIDTTISDFVADIRAATPSAAAELVSPDSEQIKQFLAHKKQQLHSAWRHRLAAYQQQLQQLQSRLSHQHPANQLMQQQQRLDELQMRLHRAMEQRFNHQQQHLGELSMRLQRANPAQRVASAKYQLQQLSSRLVASQKEQLYRAQSELSHLATRLDSISPLAVLGRGYSITRADSGIIKSVQQVQPGQTLHTRVADGEVTTTVVGVQPKD
ncbi:MULTISPECIES: exodeoxyribonuclease VII large subunit [Pseudoalteromonas]|uniref:Exodeoxyribonuclease 7 large subunit n=1 Tax=Pseudoalteromonas ruthenica TaxID=151081 RepID=A0A0F4PLW1_9GAMM|nr:MULTISPECIES: exodeoxyribonuclease VII large subunit [Pseudoalteromonas]KJY96495.1 exodeoxyribonuclease VII large subunit [Pseudoalteromonas ruthenica]KJY98366.1 exodeoxyribonuclease VII large subunit [Pseudoalteromonas ruthenica]MCG7570205.1 exodeoxyribonuclease VII large subunit [Pseudoalteromonas sp. CNC9-20]RZF77623.1 exodeoxyribonuclease VII large subunit [Pseudoalteromonas sp. CO325X]TMO93980.1 exodeoxyribonuclease VII large subunit [Pseudoalteromonas ruthenica]